MTNRLQTLLDEKSILLADGAMATNLFPLGLKPGDAAEVWNLSAPWKIADLHQQFVEAGADILLTVWNGTTKRRMCALLISPRPVLRRPSQRQHKERLSLRATWARLDAR